MLRSLAWLSAAVLLVPLLTGCGGTSNNEPTYSTFTVFLAAEGAYEGTLGAGGIVAENGMGLTVGDRDGDPQPGPLRAFVSFNLSTLPSNAIVTQAQLRLNLNNVLGDPFGTLGNVIVDHVNYGPQFPPAGAYDSAAFTILGNVATLATNAILGEKVATVTFPVNTDRAAPRQRSQFRLRFSAADTNNDGNPTFVRFQDAEQGGGGGSVPLLIVTYDVPN